MEKASITGKYRHYKGGEYEVIDEAKHTETGERLVVYRQTDDPTKLWARPYDMFFEDVVIKGIKTPRFQKISD